VARGTWWWGDHRYSSKTIQIKAELCLDLIRFAQFRGIFIVLVVLAGMFLLLFEQIYELETPITSQLKNLNELIIIAGKWSVPLREANAPCGWWKRQKWLVGGRRVQLASSTILLTSSGD